MNAIMNADEPIHARCVRQPPRGSDPQATLVVGRLGWPRRLEDSKTRHESCLTKELPWWSGRTLERRTRSFDGRCCFALRSQRSAAVSTLYFSPGGTVRSTWTVPFCENARRRSCRSPGPAAPGRPGPAQAPRRWIRRRLNQGSHAGPSIKNRSVRSLSTRLSPASAWWTVHSTQDACARSAARIVRTPTWLRTSSPGDHSKTMPGPS